MAESLEKAQALIMAGLVEVNGQPAQKAGQVFPESATIILKKNNLPYVSRGGLKLAGALEAFGIDVQDKVVLDVGASTGGFTDCLLQKGAAKVIAVDVGYGQLHWKLRQDPRVQVLEKQNIRFLGPEKLKEPLRGAVIDVSFISLKLVLPNVARLLEPDSFIIALIKPQFEVGKGLVGKGGVVRDAALHQQVVKELIDFCTEAGWAVQGLIESPILGPKGNKEFLIYLGT
ncbi:MAG: TlyA family RNA methyltransferase [Desulfobacteraceae bacterium]|nr:MAG: TlyA family RNA methyltransferase [Desulfobacteraceae bacterium]